MRRKDLALGLKDGVIVQGELTVAKSKTEAGEGRTIPLSKEACATLTLWLSRFPDAGPESYVFPRHRLAFAGDHRPPVIWEVKLDCPIGEWKKAWRLVCKEAGVRYRWHDLRHTFVSRLAESPHISEETIRSLAGHVSQSMLRCYSHIRTQAKQAAIAALEKPISTSEGAQKWAQFLDGARPELPN